MSTIVTRSGKGSPLTHTEVDNNFTNLNTDKYQSGNNASFGTLSASGAFSANGGATLGDASGDALTINSSAVSIPNGLNFDSNTFVIDATNNRVGVGTASPSFALDVQSGNIQAYQNSATSTYFLAKNSVATSGVAFGVTSAGLGYIDVINSNSLILATADTERMRIDSSGNVGIGTSSPSSYINSKLTVATGMTIFANNETWYHTNVPNNGTDLKNWRFGGVSGGGFSFQTVNDAYNSATNRMSFDSSGNLGLGVIPQTWGGSFSQKAIQISSAGSISSLDAGAGNTQLNISNNAYDFLSPKYLTNSSVVAYRMVGQSHLWLNAPSGTAGNAITFTQAMTLDANGNLLVGTTSAAFNSSGRGLLEVNGSTNSLIALKANNSALVYFHNTGTDLNIQNNSNGSLLLATNSAERMRIDSSGNLLVGTTGGLLNERIRANFGAGNTGITVSVASTATQSHIVFYNGAVVGTISTNGSTTTYATSSDYRLKENISPMTGALARVSALKPVTYTWKADGSDGQGFIAHELAEVVPDCVSGEKDAVDAEGKPVYQGIDTSFLVATLTAAIQELKAEVDALKAQINQ
jgi:hypothetical protein